MKISLFLLCSLFFSAVGAFEELEDSRDLLGFGCNGKLKACKRTGAGNALPTANLTAALSVDAPPGRATLKTDLLGLVNGSATVDFTALIKGIKKLSLRKRRRTIRPGIRTAINNIVKIDISKDGLTVSVNNLSNIVSTLVGLLGSVAGGTLDILTTVVSTLNDFITIEASVSGAVASVTSALQAAVDFVNALLKSLLALNLNIILGTKCMASLENCDFKKMALELIPDLTVALYAL